MSLGYQLSNLVEINIANKLLDLLKGEGYTIGYDKDEIQVVQRWSDWDFTLPSMALEVSNANSEVVTGLGTDVDKRYTLIIRAFGRSRLECKQLAEFIKNFFDDNNIELLDYNLATPAGDGWIRLYNNSWSLQRVQAPEDRTENMSVIGSDINVKSNLI